MEGGGPRNKWEGPGRVGVVLEKCGEWGVTEYIFSPFLPLVLML